MSRFATNRLLVSGAALGLGGMLASGWGFGWERFWGNWVLWTLFLLTIGLGCLFIVGLEHLVGAKWSIPIRRIPERLSGLVLLMSPALLLALLSLQYIYPWTRPESLANPVIAGKAAWLNVPFFIIRLLICLVLWLVSYRILVTGSFRQDSRQDFRFSIRARRMAPLFMAIFGITLTVVAFDWILALEPTWYSDILGVYLFAGTFLAALSATSLLLIHQLAGRKLPGVGPDHVYNLGGFIFAFTVFWGYIGFAQYLLMWYANLPEEVVWYQERLKGLWLVIVLVIAAFHFLVPFLVLMPRDAKSNLRRLGWVSMLVLTAHWLDLYWMIMPALGNGPQFGWMELAFALFFVSLTLLWIRRALTQGADMPIGDPFLREGLEFRL
jgi:hypothetical protein